MVSMVKHADPKMAVMKQEVYYAYRFPKHRTCGTQGHMGSPRVSQEPERGGGAVAGAFLVVSVGRNRRGRVSRLGIGQFE